MWNRWPFMSARDLETKSHSTLCAATALAEAPDWQIIEKYWNTVMQKNHIWYTAFEALTKKILKEVC